jgi:hypothetical protein
MSGKMNGLTIGRLAIEPGVNVGTIRYYQLRRLLYAPRRPRSGFGTYSREADEVRHELMHQLKYLSSVTIHVDPLTASGEKFHRIEDHKHDNFPPHSH